MGVSDESKVLGPFGPCGRPFCCATFLSNFKPVSIKIDKEQGISLNPAKISGTCGRLKCCLNQEEKVYEELNKKMSMIDDTVLNKDGLKGRVININTLKQLVKVAVELKNEEKEIREYKPSNLKFKKRQRTVVNDAMEAESRQLEELEKHDVYTDL